MVQNCYHQHCDGVTQYNTTSFISNIEHNNITPPICTQHWDGWKGGGQKNNLIVVHPQHDQTGTFTIMTSTKLKLRMAGQ